MSPLISSLTFRLERSPPVGCTSLTLHLLFPSYMSWMLSFGPLWDLEEPFLTLTFKLPMRHEPFPVLKHTANSLVRCWAQAESWGLRGDQPWLGSLPPKRIWSVHFTHSSILRVTLPWPPASKSKISQSPSVQSALAVQTLLQDHRGLFLGTVCS
jgi:hypothetical protein